MSTARAFGFLSLALALSAATDAVEPAMGSVDAPVVVNRREEPLVHQLQHQWVLRRGKHWQIASSDFEDPDDTDALENNRGPCPAGMVHVEGRMKREPWFGAIEAMQSSTCLLWTTETFPEQCGEFDRDRWLGDIARMRTKPMSFCIDRFEYPDVKGQYPWIVVSWTEAAEICGDEGKRLCTEDEWTFACEGEEAWPYPYGFARSSEACVIDRPWRRYDQGALNERTTDRTMLELDRLWQGESSGSEPLCRSPAGVYDMTGNVDEWTTSTRPRGNQSIMKGGYWGEVRDRCRASTRIHGEEFAFYQQGFRCCAAVP